MFENRKYTRVPCNLRCWCEGNNVTVYARIGNLSEGGLLLRMDTPLKHGAQAVVRFEGTSPVKIAARVVWSKAGGQGAHPGMGLQFEPDDPQVKDAIRSIVDTERQHMSVTY